MMPRHFSRAYILSYAKLFKIRSDKGSLVTNLSSLGPISSSLYSALYRELTPKRWKLWHKWRFALRPNSCTSLYDIKPADSDPL